MLERIVQEKKIKELEEEIDKYLASEIDPVFLNKLLDELEELLCEREDYYKLRIVK